MLFFSIFMFVNNSFADWIWQNPLPQAQLLLGIDFNTPQSGWAVGFMGTILRSYDGGENWVVEHVDQGIHSSYRQIQFINENEGWYLYDDGQGEEGIRHTTDGGETWLSYPTDNSVQLSSFVFFDSNIGWAAGSAIYYTEDSGQTWDDVFNESDVTFLDIEWATEQKAWAVGYRTLNNQQSGVIFFTNDGAETWELQAEFSQARKFNQLASPDSLHAWAGGENGMIARTSDGGNSWDIQQVGYDSDFIICAYFLNNQEGWAGGFNIMPVLYPLGFLYHTTDGGETWETQYAGKSSFSYIGYKEDEETVWYVGYGGAIYSSDESGENWQLHTPGTRNWLWDADFVNSQTGWVIGDVATVFATTDGGETWEQQMYNEPDSADYWWNGARIDFLDENYGWVGGDEQLAFTTNGGVTWEIIPFENYGYRLLHFFDETTGIATRKNYDTYETEIVRTTDGGYTWNIQCITNAMNSIHFIGDEGWLVGYDGTNPTILHTTDTGLTWEELAPPNVLYLNLQDVYFKDSLNGWIVGNLGVWRTIDGGNTWNSVPIDVTLGEAIAFSEDGQWGWITNSYGEMWYTQDAGESWEEYPYIDVNQLNEVVIADNYAWAFGGARTIVRWNQNDVSIKKEHNLINTPQRIKNYPNPFNPTTTIAFTIPKTSQVYLGIYDISGKLIKTLIDAPIEAGYHTVMWDGTDDNGSSVASGVYFYKLKSKGYEKTKKMLLLK